jgi:hypothetical protein
MGLEFRRDDLWQVALGMRAEVIMGVIMPLVDPVRQAGFAFMVMALAGQGR